MVQRLSIFACALPTHMSLCRTEDASSAKYSLTHTVRTHLGRRHDAFSCMVRLFRACQRNWQAAAEQQSVVPLIQLGKLAFFAAASKGSGYGELLLQLPSFYCRV